jgi:hypothetical protein
MKTAFLNLIEATLWFLLSVLAFVVRLIRRGWLSISRSFLKRYLNVETRAYCKWHNRQVAKIQQELDYEHTASTALSHI